MLRRKHLQFWGLDTFRRATRLRNEWCDSMSKVKAMRFPSPSTLILVLAMSLPFAAQSSQAQTAAPPGTGDHFKDTSMFKPPAGARVAVVEFEDLECPACAHAYPIVHAAVAQYKIPLVRHDF